MDSVKTTVSLMFYVPESPRSPTIYPLSLPRSMSKDPVVVGCLIKDYFPSGTMKVSWSKSGADVTTINFPPAQTSGGPFTMSSQLTLPASQCPAEENVTCSVQQNSNPAKDVDVPCLIDGERVICGWAKSYPNLVSGPMSPHQGTLEASRAAFLASPWRGTDRPGGAGAQGCPEKGTGKQKGMC